MDFYCCPVKNLCIGNKKVLLSAKFGLLRLRLTEGKKGNKAPNLRHRRSKIQRLFVAAS